jgi:hypothetical protein
MLQLLMCLVILLGALSAPAPAQAQPRRPKVLFDEDKTPLQKALEANVNERRRAARQTQPDCTDAKLAEIDASELALGVLLAIENPTREQRAEIRDLRRTLRTLARDCQGPGKSARKVAQQDVVRGGRRTGKRLLTETVIDYETPDQRNPSAGGGWPRMVVDNLNPDEFANRFAAENARVLGASFLSATPINNDEDCIDRVTNVVSRACLTEGVVRQTMTRTAAGCRHESGAEFVADATDGLADDCFDDAGVLQTSLRELVDEDWEDDVDQDKDGLEGEDGPDNEAGSDPCAIAGGTATATGCDLTAVAIRAANARSMELHGVKAFKADDNGVCNDALEGGVACGAERRRVKVNEALTARCRQRGGHAPAELVDGHCVDTEEQTLGAGGGVADGLYQFVEARNGSASVLDTPLAAPDDPDCQLDATNGGYTCTKTGMMGFTVMPPVWEWGFQVSEDVCIDLLFDEFCFEIFYARIGYEFDFATGLRLPVDLTVKNVPARVTAGTPLTFPTELKPSENFTVGNYKEFCLEHNLASSSLIRDCDSFAEPEFLSSLDFTKSEDEQDGGELIARLTAFAGLQVRLVGIPLINWALDVDVDLPKMCTLNQIRRLLDDGTLAPGDLVGLGTGIAKRQHLYDLLREALGVCGSFQTPFGYEEAPITGVPRLRSFPFAERSIPIPADCSPDPRDVTTTDKDGTDKKKKICTGLILGAHGASLGVGMEFVTRAGSTLIQAALEAEGDSCIGGGVCPDTAGSDLNYRVEPGQPSALLNVGPIRFDNYDGTTDEARVNFDDLLYHLNAFQIEVKGTLEFGGILSPLPDLLSLTLLTITLDAGDNSPIRLPQHNGTRPMTVPVFVENYALGVDAKPADTDPNRVDENTLLIKPGDFGQFRIYADNLGSDTDAAFNFSRLVSNQPGQVAPFRYVINLNTDFDCIDSSGVRFRGYPYDGAADDCYTATGNLRTDRTEAIDEDSFGPGTGPVASRDEDGDGFADEDPPDQWPTTPTATEFGVVTLPGIPAHRRSEQFRTLSISPFQHPLTRPGTYPLEIRADSHGAVTRGMAAVDPLGNPRVGAFDTVFIRVDSFLDPRVALAPTETSILPGGRATYQIEGANYGNIADTIQVHPAILDSNQDGCTLTTLGGSTGCPDRVEITALPQAWLITGALPGVYGPFEPLGSSSIPVTIDIPSTWAGMEDATYEITFRAQSTADPVVESDVQVLRQRVRATKQSMTRYIGLEIRSFIEELERANTAGIATGGLLAVLIHPVEATHLKALAAVVAGDAGGASKMQETMIKVMEGFMRQLASRSQSVPANLATDWTARGTAILSDLAIAAAAPGVADASTKVVVTASAPGAPQNVRSNVTGDSVALIWDAPRVGLMPTGYVLEAGNAPGLANLAVVPLGSSLSFATNGVMPGTYYVRVRAVNAVGIGAPSGELTIVVR